jgi:hypothetical protein
MSDKEADAIRARGGVPVKAFLYNKREDLDNAVNGGAHDIREDEANALIVRIQGSFDNILERRRRVEGVGIIYTQYGKFKDVLWELFELYELGFYNSTILLCGTLAERICYDLIDFMAITIDGIELDAESKKRLYKLGFRELVGFLVDQKYISKEDRSLLHQIYDTRNTYTHLEGGGNAELDSITTLNRMYRVLENLFSMFKFYDVKDDVFYPKEEYKGRVVEQPEKPLQNTDKQSNRN